MLNQAITVVLEIYQESKHTGVPSICDFLHGAGNIAVPQARSTSKMMFKVHVGGSPRIQRATEEIQARSAEGFVGCW